MGNYVNYLNVKNNARNRIFKRLSLELTQLDTVQKDTLIEELATTMSITHHKPYNSIQKETGYELTTYQCCTIKYIKVFTIHVKLVQDEFTHCSIQFLITIKITGYKKLLKNYDKKKQHSV